jgi:hypothetical protein
MAEFERVPPTEGADIASIVRSVLHLQEKYALEAEGPLARGTHAKGVGARAVFEVFDVNQTLDDPALAARLARGLYAVPGRYPAVVRFANAYPRAQSDAKADGRALSFSVMMPTGGAEGERRVDFSMNSAPVMPANDVHDFAVLMRVVAADGVRGRLRALTRLSFADLRGFIRTLVRTRRQMRKPRTGYQCMRYWSMVPFAHGDDDVIKYSAIPLRSNPSQPLHGGPSQLRDELWRHLAEDRRMAAFDFCVQLLDASRMTHRGLHHEPEFWVENASVEWDETEAPFHRVARLTLLPASQLSAAECEAMYIDVTEHRADESRPLGGVNRARWHAERQSRLRRLGDAAD